MATAFKIPAHDDHVLQRTAILKLLREERGEVKTDKGYWIPKSPNSDIMQVTEHLDHEFGRSRVSASWYKDADKDQWLRDRAKIARHLQGADPKALYPHGDWFWNRAMLKLAILLQVAKTRPSPTELFLESLEETIHERLSDTDQLIDNAGETISEVADAGEKWWSGLKTAGLIAAGLIGVAVVVPPIIRAFRD